MADKIILILDSGNINRSVIAAFLMKKALFNAGLLTGYEVHSRRGLGYIPEKGIPRFPNFTYYSRLYSLSEEWLSRHGIDKTEFAFRAERQVEASLARRANVILAIDHETLESFQRVFKEDKDKAHLFTELVGEGTDIPDTAEAEDKETLEKTYERIYQTIDRGLPTLLALAERKPEVQCGREFEILKREKE